MKHWIKKFEQLWKPMYHPMIAVYAASSCYFFILSIVPTSLVLFSIFALFPSYSEFDSAINMLVPDYISVLIRPLENIRNQNPIGLLSISGLIAIWSASKGILTLRFGLHISLNMCRQESYLERRVQAIVLLILIVLLFMIGICTVLLSERFLAFLYSKIITVPSWIPAVTNFRYLITFMIIITPLTFCYYFLSGKKLNFRNCILAGCISSVLCLAFSSLYSVYVNRISNYPIHYGMFGAAILGMIWIRICFNVMLYAGRFVYLMQYEEYKPLRIIRTIISK